MPDTLKNEPVYTMGEWKTDKTPETTTNLLKCDICGLEFAPNKRTHYIARDNTGILGGPEPTYYDAFDCPVCGRQIIAGERKRSAVDITDLLNDESEETCSEQV